MLECFQFPNAFIKQFVESNKNMQIILNIGKKLNVPLKEMFAFKDLTLLMPSVFTMLRVKQSAVHANSRMWETAEI